MKISEETKKDLVLLGLRIKNLREERNFSINELAKKAGLRAQYLKKIEQGAAYGVLLNKHLAKIVYALDIKMSVLFSFEKISQ